MEEKIDGRKIDFNVTFLPPKNLFLLNLFIFLFSYFTNNGNFNFFLWFFFEGEDYIIHT